jgi:hypothetical protein
VYPLKKNSLHLAITVLVYIILATNVFSQKTIVTGTVKDITTNEPLPFVNILLKNTKTSTVSDIDGNFRIETNHEADTIVINCFGYSPMQVPITKKREQYFIAEMVPTDISLDEVVVFPGENPAHPILRNILKQKGQNSPEKLGYFDCEVYNKLQIDLNNYDENLKNKKFLKNFRFIFENEDSSELMGKKYLPVFISENYSKYFYQRKPERRKEIILASRISGIENKSYSEFTGQMYIEINLYENYVSVFGKQFVSPFSSTGLLVYKYYLKDSALIDNQYCYQITFKPKRKQERTFYGDFWVDSNTWGIKKVHARISEDANLNYVKELIINHEYTYFGDSIWFKTRDEVFTDINLFDKQQGFFGRKQTMYKNINLDPPKQPNFFSNTEREESVLDENLNTNDLKQWDLLRPEKLTEEQEKIYDMVDSVQNVPLFRTVTDLIYMMAYGYYLYKDFEFGPYFKTFSFNPIEGSRFRIGGRTSNEFSTNLMIYGHLAYGTKDQNFKYGIGALYLLKKYPRLSFDFFYENDMALLGQSVNAFSEDNFLASILSIRPNDNLLPVLSYRLAIEKEWFKGFTSELKLYHGIIKPSVKIPFDNISHALTYNKLIVSEANLLFRFSYNEKIIRGEFERVSLGSKYPILRLELTKGFRNILKSDFSYSRLRFRYDHTVDIKPIGYSKYGFGIGKIWGKVPFPFLILHEGNETYALDQEAFNLMNYYEFASDFYQNVYFEHHFQGLFLNKIPVLRKLKWREIVSAKVIHGTIRETNKHIWMFPNSLGELNKPYIEAGFGIENIFKIVRIDAIWRITNRNKEEINTFGIRAKLQLIF